jgi:hypothetical protein
MIRNIKHSSIDKTLWDACVDNSPNGYIYAYSWYLDIVSPGWEALVEDNYQIIMPLPIRKKLGFKYLINPYLSQQLGIISSSNLDFNVIENFIYELKKLFRYADFNFNSSNVFEHKNYINKSITQILPLNITYNELYNHYTDDCIRNITKAKKYNNLNYNISSDSYEFIRFYKLYTKFNAGHRFENCLYNLTNQFIKRNKGEINLVTDENNEIISSALWAIDNKRAYYLANCNSPKGRKLKANFAIIDNFIQKHATENIVLDFEGSMIPGVAKFNTGFGADISYYPRFKYNNLPFPFRFIKK